MPRHQRAIGYPTNRLLAVVDDAAEAASAMAELAAGGIRPTNLDLLRGEEGVARLDASGAESGRTGRLRRAVEFTLMDQMVDFAGYERALRDGRAVIVVRPGEDVTKILARDILRRHGAHFINYYGRFATEEIDLWHGPEPDIPGYMRR